MPLQDPGRTFRCEFPGSVRGDGGRRHRHPAIHRQDQVMTIVESLVQIWVMTSATSRPSRLNAPMTPAPTRPPAMAYSTVVKPSSSRRKARSAFFVNMNETSLLLQSRLNGGRYPGLGAVPPVDCAVRHQKGGGHILRGEGGGLL